MSHQPKFRRNSKNAKALVSKHIPASVLASIQAEQCAKAAIEAAKSPTERVMSDPSVNNITFVRANLTTQEEYFDESHFIGKAIVGG